MKILLAVDETPFSSLAIREVAQRPWPEGSSLRILHVLEILPMVPDAGYTAAPPFYASTPEVMDELRDNGQALVDRVAEMLERTGLHVETTVRDGAAANTILDEAKAWGADLIIMGSHGRTGIKRLLLGSVAQKVVAHAPCAVEVVRPRSQPDDAEHAPQT